MKKMKVEIWSDIMCPFCYIGKRHFEKALSKVDFEDKIEVEWKSFQLNPGLPKGNAAKLNAYEYLAKHKGISYDESVAMHQRVSKMASEAGLTYHFDKTIIANSYNAHRILQLAKEKGLGDQAEELFFHQYFTEGKDISDTKTLLELGLKLGFSAEEVDQALTQENYAKLVDGDIKEAYHIGVSGVPFFVFDKKFAVSGAQPAEAFEQALNQVHDEWKKKNSLPLLQNSDGPTCGPDGACV